MHGGPDTAAMPARPDPIARLSCRLAWHQHVLDPALEPRNRHAVATGKRILTVDERIDRHRLPGAAIPQVERMRKLEQQRAYKTLEVEVEPGMSHAIGARLRRDRLDAESIRNNEYWEPVVWDTRPERCP